MRRLSLTVGPLLPAVLASAALTSVACAPADALAAGFSSRPSETVVERVVDGDTFVLRGGERVRVLGIDSCERSTSAGPAATAQARAELEGRRVTLAVEPGVDRDRYGRLLRYVQTDDGLDYGTVMVREGHTGVYAGRNDASPARLVELRRADVGGRSC